MSVLIPISMLAGAVIGAYVNSRLQKLSVNGLLKTLKKELLNAYDEGVKYGVVKPKIERINEISKEQVAYMGNLDRPNASAAHARHKNKIVSLIKALEEEKMSLFKSILESGADPLLSVMIEGKAKSLRVSELIPLLESGNIPEDETPQSKTDSIPPGSAISKLRVVKSTQENKDDGITADPSDPAIH